MIEHCISALKLHKKQEYEQRLFQIYTTDCLMAIADNTTHFVAGTEIIDCGRKMKERWIDLLDSRKEKPKEEPEDTRSAEEIADDMWKRIRGN